MVIMGSSVSGSRGARLQPVWRKGMTMTTGAVSTIILVVCRKLTPLVIYSPGSETDAPLVALSPCVSVVPSAHGLVTGEASGLCRTAIPYRRLSVCSTRAWTVSADQEAYDLAS